MSIVSLLPACVAQLSALVARNFDLTKIIPNLLNIFKTNALVFHAPALDSAIWESLIETWKTQVTKSKRLVGVAKLHCYIDYASGDESLLWEAKTYIDNAQKQAVIGIPFSWKDIHKKHVSGWPKPTYQRKKRSQILSQLKIAADERFLSMSEIESYIDTTVSLRFMS